MSKELEALNTITHYDTEIDGRKINITYQEYLKAYTIIEKALKRNEPIKPTLDENGNYRCARCHHIVDNHYCSDCGGAADWSDENESL